LDWRFLTVREVVGMALTLLLIVFMIGIATRYSGRFKVVNSGFGPGWSCAHIPEGGGPICV